MRKGDNISKDKLLEKNSSSHRVIIPLYIPHEKDYYKESFSIFEMCLLSVKKTSISTLKISVVNTGNCVSVHSKLMALLNKGYIDELIIEKDNIGKINSILKVLRTAEERLITISDADVLFLNGWENEVMKIFKSFPKAGMVCPSPVFRTHFRITSNIWMRYLFSKKLMFSPVKDPHAMTKFANSIGWPWLDFKYKDVIATVRSEEGLMAVIGASHFVGTYKREVFRNIPKLNTKYVLGGDSEFLYTDLPVLKEGGYRLSTYDNFAFHMGNVIEDWMAEKFNSLIDAVKSGEKFEIKELRKPLVNPLFVEKLFKLLISMSFIKKWILKKKGLNKEQIKNFVA